jgi:hypothetical protein
MIDVVLGAAVLIGGLITLLGAILNKDWLLRNPSAHRIVRALGRGGARILYGFLGLLSFGLGVLAVTAALAGS